MEPKSFIIEYPEDGDYEILSPLWLIPDNNPSNKELRLALDILDIIEPLFRHEAKETKVDALRDVFKINTSKERLQRLCIGKRLITKCVISYKNNKLIIKRVKK